MVKEDGMDDYQIEVIVRRNHEPATRFVAASTIEPPDIVSPSVVAGYLRRQLYECIEAGLSYLITGKLPRLGV